MAFIRSGSGGAEKPTLLWTNASYNSNFSAQTIAFDRNKYKTVVVKFKARTDISNQWTYLIMSGSSQSQAIGIDVNNYGYYRRSGCSLNANGIYIANSIDPFGTTYNNYIIPLEMYGYETDLLSL